MNLQTSIYQHVIHPKYIRVYLLIEELSKVSRPATNLAHRKDIVNLLADIIAIKDKYSIEHKEDFKLLTKYTV
jgi:hypothetical protein